jgi:F-type H+-transporting ATPase subunit delta
VATDDTSTSSVAGRYASALFELAKDANDLQATESGLIQFEQLLAASSDLTSMVRSPIVSAEEQRKALAAVLSKAGIGGLAGNFLLLLARNRRLFVAADAIRSFRAQLAAFHGQVAAEVVSAHPLTDEQLGTLKDQLRGAAAGKDVVVSAKVDPSILGGLIVKIGSRMVDQSIRTKLNALKFAMKEVR